MRPVLELCSIEPMNLRAGQRKMFMFLTKLDAHMLSMYHCKRTRVSHHGMMHVHRVFAYLEVAPPVTAVHARALREQDVLLRVRAMERILLPN